MCSRGVMNEHVITICQLCDIIMCFTWTIYMILYDKFLFPTFLSVLKILKQIKYGVCFAENLATSEDI